MREADLGEIINSCRNKVNFRCLLTHPSRDFSVGSYIAGSGA